MKIGILASQGAYAEHISVLKQLDDAAVPVRLPGELRGIDGLVIPGGESTAISRLLSAYRLGDEIQGLAGKGLPVFGTCAGMILLSKDISPNQTKTLDLMDIKVRRNAFGRQRESFETDIAVPVLGEEPYPAVFIRAPLIERYDRGVEVLASLADGTPVAVRQGRLLASAFHPELTDDLRFHQYFLNMAAENRRR